MSHGVVTVIVTERGREGMGFAMAIENSLESVRDCIVLC